MEDNSNILPLEFSKIDDVSDVIKGVVKTFMTDDTEKIFWKKFRKRNLHLVFKNWAIHKDAEREFVWTFDVTNFYETPEECEKFLSQIGDRAGIEVDGDKFTISGQRKARFENLFIMLHKHWKIDINSRVQERDTKSDDAPGLQAIEEGVYTPTTEFIENYHFYVMICKISPLSPKFNMMPGLTQTNFSSATGHLMQVKIKIVRQIKLTEQIKFYGSYDYKCPSCGLIMNFLPHQMGKKSIMHPKCYANAGNNVSISRGSYSPAQFVDLFCYEVLTYDIQGVVSTEPKYFFSFDDSMEWGFYNCDIVNINGRISAPDDKTIRTIMLGAEPITPKLMPGLFSERRGKELAHFFRMPYHKMFDLWAAVIEYYKSKNIVLKPKKGGLIQLQLLSSTIMKILGDDKFPISVIGDTSLSKTYPARLIGPLMDTHYEFLSRGGEAATLPGLQGGISQNFWVDGKKMTYFQEGIMTSAGLCIFDEANFWYENKAFNDILKSFQDDFIKIQKIGGKTIPQKYTPVFLSNFSKHYNSINEKELSLISEIKQLYYRKVARMDEDKLKHKKNRTASDRYVSGFNVTLPLQMIKDDNLRQVVGLVRKKYMQNDIAWWTGGGLPAQNRILFDCVCKRVNTNSFEDSFCDVVNTESQNQTNLPTIDFCNTIRSYFFNNKVPYLKDLYKPTMNSEETINQVLTLKKKIEEYLNSSDDDIIVHFRDGARSVDDKLQSSIINYYIGMQLLNNPEATELDDATKYIMKCILLKCKRGVTEEEYNFIDHSYKPDKSIIESIELNDTSYLTELIDQGYKDEIKKEVREEVKAEVIEELGVNRPIDMDKPDKKNQGDE